MKKDNGFKTIAVIAFLAISLLAANAFIVNSDLRMGFEPRIVKSIINNGKNENTSAIYSPPIAPLNDDNDEEIVEDERLDKEDIRDGSGEDKCQVETFLPSASGKVVVEQSTRRVLFGDNENQRCYPASTTKILTALVTLQNLPLDQIVVVPKEAEGVEGSSIYLRAGQKISVEDLLFGLMLRSGNDAAVALAIETAGSIEAFAEMMNETARAIGAKNSHFVNPHGLHDDDHFTTPLDLALICAKAYELDDFRRIVCTKARKITVDGEVTSIANKNKLLNMFEGANGVKTGYTKKSGRCLVGGAKRGDMQLISVVFNCADMWNETQTLLKYGFDNFEMVKLDHALLTGLAKDGKREVEIVAPYNVTADWLDIKYPLRHDEYLTVRAA